MSYTPQIFVSKIDLDKKRDIIESNFNKISLKNKLENIQLHTTLHNALDLKPIIFLGISFIIIHPETTSQNLALRKWLHENEINFTTDY